MIHAVSVTPCAGVWIEIKNFGTYLAPIYVTPCAGVWIEISGNVDPVQNLGVTPCAGVWIEMLTCHSLVLVIVSLPVRECGLKLVLSTTHF